MNPFRVHINRICFSITSVSGAQCRHNSRVSTVHSLSSQLEDTYNIVSFNFGGMFSSIQLNSHLDWRSSDATSPMGNYVGSQ